MYVVLLLLAALAGCGGSDGDDMQPLADAGTASDATSWGDGAPQPPLQVEWSSLPALPGDVTSAIKVTSAKFHIDRLQVIGDAGEPTDTSRRDITLDWSTISPFQSPIYFFSAPPGIYSKVKLTFDQPMTGAGTTVDILGSVVVGALDPKPFHIISRDTTSLEVAGYSVTLSPGGHATVEIKLDLSTALGAIDWTTLPTPGGVYTLDDTQTTAMPAFLASLDGAFGR